MERTKISQSKTGGRNLRKSIEKAKNGILNAHSHAPSAEELSALAQKSGAFDFLNDPAEDIYTIKDGKPAQWPTKHIRAAA